MVEQPAVNRRVVGSNPTCGAKTLLQGVFACVVASRHVGISRQVVPINRDLRTQSNWEAFGDPGEIMARGYGSGWVLIFEQAYNAACGP